MLALAVAGCTGAAPLAKASPTAISTVSPATTPTPARMALPAHPSFRYLASGPTASWMLEFTSGVFRSQLEGPWLSVPLPDGAVPAGLFALDDNRAWAVTAADGNLRVLRTANAGVSWQGTSVGPGVAYPIGLRLTDGTHGILEAGEMPGTLYSTADGGATWTPLPGPPQPASGACNGVGAAWVQDQTFIASPGFCPGMAILLYITHDGGNTWQQLSIPQPAWQVVRLGQDLHTGANPVFLNATDGYAIAAAAGCCGGGPAHYWALLATHDGGSHWGSRVLPQPTIGIDYSRAPLLRLVVDQGSGASERWWAYETRDDGATSTQLGQLPEATSLIAFRDQMHGFAAGLSLLSTDDGGHSWTPITP